MTSVPWGPYCSRCGRREHGAVACEVARGSPYDAVVVSTRIVEAARLTDWEITEAVASRIVGVGYQEVADAATAKALRWGILGFARAILHGDDVHRTWLLAAAEQYIQDGTVPTAVGAATPTPKERRMKLSSVVAKTATTAVDAEGGGIDALLAEIAAFRLENNDAPFFTEKCLYKLLGKDDARYLLHLMRRVKAALE